MTAEMIVAILSGVGTLLGSVCGILASNRLTTYRIKKLEEKVDKHNSVIERVYRLEESAKSAHHRIDEIREELTHEN